ncbi:MAG: carbohydrate-binding family V/XII, partial [Candidatus Acidiferrales bacterium]
MRMGRRVLTLAMVAIGWLSAAATSRAQEQDDAQQIDTSWPREFQAQVGKVIIYQPQLDTLEGNVLSGRAALSIQAPGKDEPVFGALWFQAEVSVDRDAGLMTLEDTKITRVRFPDASSEQMDKYRDIIGKETNTWDIVLTLEQVETSLAASKKEIASTENLKSDPPVILFSQKPAVLVSFDGEPETRPIQDSPYERVVNTAFLIIKDKNSGTFYLSNGQNWYSAKSPKGPWTTTTNPPAAIKDFVKPDPDAEPQTGPPPQILTATEPTELIVTSGAPNWTPMTGNALLYVSNTESTMIKELATNKYFVLLSGRWFSSQALDGPWTYERSDQLPASFKQIAPASPIGDALTAVAGTNQAE